MLLLARVGLVGLMCGSLVACSGDDGANPMAESAGTSAGGSAGTGGAIAGSTGTGGAIAGSAGTGGAIGGSAGTAAGTGGASAGSGGTGGAAVDPNGGAPGGPASSRQTARPLGSVPGTTAGYYEYLPPHYGNGALYPLLVFRHGIGENGNGSSELQKVLAHGPPKLIKADMWPEDRKFVVLSVQHPGGGCATVQETDEFIKFAKDEYDVDPKRVYLTGLSCGAIGSWDYLGAHTNEDVAAAVLVCGDGRNAFKQAGCNLGKVPIWAFHGEVDATVDPKGSIETVASLKACTAPAPVDVKLTTYPGVGHDSWSMTYDLSNPQNDIYAWLMTHTKM
jgi:predicted esterase